jgi:GT2 family glycosyltransferase
VIVVNWNGSRTLSRVLESVCRQRYKNIELIVVDNGSTDGSLDLLKSDPSVRLIANPGNRGFAAANNQALSLARGEFVLLLNNDAILTEDYVGTLVADLLQDPGRGSVCGKLLRPPDSRGISAIDSAGHIMFRNVWPMNRGEGEADGPAYEGMTEVFGVCAAAALYRRAMLDDVAVNGEVLDSTFFAYLEDVDLDWRARLRGWSSWYDGRVTAYHERSGTGLWFSTTIQRHILKNRLLMAIKNDGGPSLPARLPGIIALTGAKALQTLLSRPRALLAFVDVVRLLPSTLRKRRVIQGSRRIELATLERWYQPFPYGQKLRERRLGRSRRMPGTLAR